ncbi:MAG: DsbA family protein [Propionibacteriaceae bacterium]|nr:DsbA family protein [Propionibacteriaceae bacterium]
MAKNTKANNTNGHMNRREILRQQQAAQARRKRTITVVCIALAVVVVIAAVALIVTHVNSVNHQKNTAGAATAQIKPPDLTSDGTAIIVNPAAKDAALTIDVHEDFQCPICKSFEDTFGSAMNQIIDNNQALVRYHVRSFLDINENNDWSNLAAQGAMCADTVGKFKPYHDTVFANQPAVEGTGYTNQELSTTFAQQAGITGDDLTKFQACYNNHQTSQVVSTMESLNMSAGVQGTPAFFVNGKSIDLQTLAGLKSNDAATLLAAFQKAAGLS